MSHKTKRKKLTDFRFVGGRFEENKGYLEIDVLPELIAYKKILVETAKEEWRRRNPGKPHLPKGFEKDIRVAFHEVKEGSATVPLERIIDIEDLTEDMFPDEPDAVDKAAEIIDSTLEAAANDRPLPENLPARIIPMFEALGKSLHGEETIEFRSDRSTKPVSFDRVTRARLLGSSKSDYKDPIDVVGEVRAASLLKSAEGGNFRLQLDNGQSPVEGHFSAEQESLVTEALHKHANVRVRVQGIGKFAPNGSLQEITEINNFQIKPSGEEKYDANAEPIWKTIAEIGESVPDEEWEKVPSDLSVNMDHYLYGLPKVEK